MGVDKDEIIGALNDLVKSLGWKYLVHKLSERRSRHVAALLAESSTNDMEDVRALQAAIWEIDYIIKLPEQEMRALQAALNKEKKEV